MEQPPLLIRRRASSRLFISMITAILAQPILASPAYTSKSLQPPFKKSFPSSPRHFRKDSVDRFVSDLDHLKTLSSKTKLLSPTHSKRDSSYTKSWTNEDWDRHQVRSFFRYQRHLRSWAKSPTALAVFPMVAALTLWSLFVFYIAQKSPRLTSFLERASFAAGVSSFAAPISLLLALRTNRALNRLLEARSMFGKMVRSTGSLAGLVVTYLAPLDPSDALLMGRYLSIFGWTVKGLLRGEEDHVALQTILPRPESAWVIASPADTPVTIVFRLRQMIAKHMHRLPLPASKAMEARLAELEVVLGVCKRLIGSPIPPTYTRHTSRVLCLYLGLLPVALVGSKVSLFAILLNVILLSYVFVGIDEIGVEIEHPFPLLPMYYLSLAMQKNVANQFVLKDRGLPPCR